MQEGGDDENEVAWAIDLAPAYCVFCSRDRALRQLRAGTDRSLVFSTTDLSALSDGYATLQPRLDALADAYAFFPYKTQDGKQYATHGFLRRFSTMHHCIERVFPSCRPNRTNDHPTPFCSTLQSIFSHSL